MADLDPNRYASPDEAASLHEDIAAAEAARLDLEEQIFHSARRVQNARRALRDAECLHAELVVHRKLLKKRVLRARGLLHPIRRLPDELLAMIFKEWMRASRNPLRMSHYATSVCRLWRHVAIGVSQLWDVVDVDLEHVDSYNIESWTEYLDTYRLRAGILPLDVTIYGGWDNLSDSPAAANFWNAVGRCISRAHTVYMEVGGHDLDPNITSCARVNCPHLESFTFSVDLDSGSDTRLPFLRSAPRLKTVRLWGVSPLWDDAEIFPDVTASDVYGINADGLLDVFHHMPNTTRLNLIGFNISSRMAVPSFSLRNDLIVELKLNIGETSHAAIARNVRFPSLKKATLSCRDRDTVSGDTLTALLRHVLVTAEQLTYAGPLEVALVEGLRALTNLKYFSTERFEDTSEAVLAALSRPDSHGAWLLPKLEQLVLGHDDPSDSLRHAILQLACARAERASPATRPPHALRSLTFLDISFPSGRRVRAPLVDEINAILAAAA